MLEKVFRLKQNNTNIKTEAIAGVTTFMTMAYILAVNPSVLSKSGMEANAVFVATALAAFFGCVVMAFTANLPFALAPGLGLNAFFAYEVCGSYGYPWQVGLLFVFVEAVLFLLLTVTNIANKLLDAIPKQLVKGLTVGVGLFIAFVGFQGGKVVVRSESTLVSVVKFSEEIHTEGICALLTIIGLLILAILYVKNVKGSILIAIIVTWILGIISQLTGIYQVDEANGFYSLIPTSVFSVDFSSIGSSFGQCFNANFSDVKLADGILIVFSFLFIDFFNTMGSVLGLSEPFNDRDGKLPGMKKVLVSCSIANMAGAIFGTSSTTIYVENSSGIHAGGRTGLSTIVTGILFVLSIFFAPIFTAVPSFATAPALIFVGFLMAKNVVDIDFKDITEALPAYLCFLCMPLLYSISDGIGIGIISYVVINLIAKKAKNISIIMYILAALFVMKFLFM